MLQECWVEWVNEILQNMPVLFEDDPVAEKRRDGEVAKLRSCIAQRWLHLFRLKSSMPHSEWAGLCEELTGCIAKFVEDNGDDIPYAPDMNRIVVLKDMTDHVPIQVEESPKQKSLSSASSSRSSAKMMLSHEFKWVEMRHGVWTVLKAVKCSK